VPALDDRIAEIAADPGRTWGFRDALLGLLAVPAVFAVTVALLSVVPEVPGALATALATVGLAAVAVALARRAARQSGGWERALGLQLPEWSDLGRIIVWSLLLFVAQERGVVGLRDEPLLSLLLFAVLAAAVAPVLEELLFRGLVLRGLMLRLGFWPAATVSSVFFGLFHAQSTGRDAVVIVVATAVFGLGLCVLTRRTGRLGPGIGVHALRNALAIVFATTGAGA
jgi:membrane protease YdiL (CAAX protease family)